MSLTLLKPFIEESLHIWLYSAKKENNVHGFKNLLKSYVSVLKIEDVQEELKVLMIGAISQIFIEITQMKSGIQDAFIGENYYNFVR